MVSIIITTRNEESNIHACLKSLQEQTDKHSEIIVVDNGSTDKTKAVAKQFGASVFDKGPERSSQRNFGASKASGQYLLFLDADMIITPTVIEDCISEVKKNKSLKALVIPEKSIGSGFWAKCKALERSFYEGIDWIEAARFYNKDIFITMSGYDERLTGPEDFDLPQRLKAKFGNAAVGRISSYILHNEGNLSLTKTIRKKFYYGKKMAEYLKKSENRHVGAKQGNLFARYALFFSLPSRLFADPIVGLGMLLMKTFEMTALAFGTISGSL